MPPESDAGEPAGIAVDTVNQPGGAFTGSVANILAYHRRYGRLPFPISGGSQENDGDGGDGKADGKGDGKGGDAQQGDDDQDDDDDEESVDGLKSALERERDARKKAQRELRQLKKQGTGSQAGRQQSGSAAGSGQGNQQQGNLQQGDSEEVVRLRSENATIKATAERAQRENLTRDVRDQARTIAKTLGAVDPDAIARMVQLDDVDVTDDGKPEGVDDAVRDLKKAHPTLFGKRAPGSGDGGTGNGGSNGGGGASKDVGTGVSRIRHAYGQSERTRRR